MLILKLIQPDMMQTAAQQQFVGDLNCIFFLGALNIPVFSICKPLQIFNDSINLTGWSYF